MQSFVFIYYHGVFHWPYGKNNSAFGCIFNKIRIWDLPFKGIVEIIDF